jgi:putative lipase involved disintegration of autophagic bodies
MVACSQSCSQSPFERNFRLRAGYKHGIDDKNISIDKIRGAMEQNMVLAETEKSITRTLSSLENRI